MSCKQYNDAVVCDKDATIGSILGVPNTPTPALNFTGFIDPQECNVPPPVNVTLVP